MNQSQSDIKEIISRRTKDGKWMQGCRHTVHVLNHNNRNIIIENTIKLIKSKNLSFDTIACSGVSGLLVVPRLCEILNKNILLVRKPTEKRYSPFIYEGVIPNKYLIIDDLVCSGQTIKHILKTIKEESAFSECVGFISYLKEDCSYRDLPDLFFKQLGIPYL